MRRMVIYLSGQLNTKNEIIFPLEKPLRTVFDSTYSMTEHASAGLFLAGISGVALYFYFEKKFFFLNFSLAT